MDIRGRVEVTRANPPRRDQEWTYTVRFVADGGKITDLKSQVGTNAVAAYLEQLGLDRDPIEQAIDDLGRLPKATIPDLLLSEELLRQSGL